MKNKKNILSEELKEQYKLLEEYRKYLNDLIVIEKEKQDRNEKVIKDVIKGVSHGKTLVLSK